MPEALANLLVAAIGAYLAAGVAFAVAFHAGGIRRIDAGAARGTWGFRVVVTPGVILLWPLLAARWRRGAGGAARAARRAPRRTAAGSRRMIDRLRRRHRSWTLALAILVPPAFAVALAARPPPPPPADLAPLLEADPAAGPERWMRDDLWGPLAIRTRWFAPAGDGGPVVELAPTRDLRRPSLLVYWAPAATAASSGPAALPPGAHLAARLAGVEPRRFALPPAAREEAGRLYLYSLGHGELVGSAVFSGAP